MIRLYSFVNKFKVIVVGLVISSLVVPFGAMSVSADSGNGYYITSTSTSSVGSIRIKGGSAPDVSTVTINALGHGLAAHTPVDVVLVIDASGSMGGAPMADEVIAAKAFVDKMDPLTDQVSVIPFATDVPQSPETIQQLTSNFTNAKSYIDDIDNLNTIGGVTNYEAALQAANVELSSARRNQSAIPVLVFMSDGSPNQGNYDPSYLIGLADAMKNNGVHVYTIGLGVSDTDGVDLLTSISSSTPSTSDHYFSSPTPDGLLAIYNAVAASLPTLVATNVKLSLKFSNLIEVVPGSFSIAPSMFSMPGSGATIPGANDPVLSTGVYEFNLPDSLNGKTSKLTFNVKIPAGTVGQTVQVLAALGSGITYDDYLSVASTTAVQNVGLTILGAPITAPNTAIKQFISANPLASLAMGIVGSLAILILVRRRVTR